jgi:CRISPR/Cas system-associated exonuclease Cas4 (RecB family)
MTRNLLKQVMVQQPDKPAKKKFVQAFDVDGLVEQIKSGYTVDRGPKHTKKKTFAPSTIAYGHGVCPRYWYLAFEGNIFEDEATPDNVANMENGTLSHERIQSAMMKSNVAKVFKDDNGQDTTEFKIINNDPGIFGYGDAIVEWNGEELAGEIKTMSSEAFEYFKNNKTPKKGHLVQLLIYMKILKKARGVLIYENKNNHDMIAFPVEVNDGYRKWVDYAFDWMREVKKASDNQTLPTKNYRANSKVCKSCPVKAACAEAEAGTIKIASLEELSETM